MFKKMSASINLRKKESSLTLQEDELLAKRVSSYLCLYNKTSKEHNVSENVTGIVCLYQLLIYLYNFELNKNVT